MALRQEEVDRKSKLLASKVVARSDIERGQVNLGDSPRPISLPWAGPAQCAEPAWRNPDATLGPYGPWLSAKAAVDRAQWYLDQTVLKAPLDGVATQVSNIQLGSFLAAGSPVFAIVSDQDVLVDANPKETDITWLKPEQRVTVMVDAFPDRPLKGHVASISPGTGAQFSLIPAQNASGNWVKVVQRVPVRIDLDSARTFHRCAAA